MTRAQTFGRYELLSRISAGGMAEVFRATHTPSGTAVALKRILPEIAEDDDFIQMFEDEARIVSSLEHPHIARCLDFGRVDAAWFISFEFVDGKDLRTLFDRCTREGAPPPIWFIVHVFSRVGEGLAYAHARKDPKTGAPISIVHRDVSPQNIVVSYDGDVKLIDFGIAKAVGKLSRTQVGTIKGKFGYMSPEQVAGREVDARADVFSMGICLWELLTLKRLFLADDELLVLEKIRSTVVPPPSTYNRDVPPELDRIVLKALAKDLDERYRSARDLYRDLNHLAQSINVVATREQIAQYMRRVFPTEGAAAAAASAGAPGGPSQSARPQAAERQETRQMAADNKGSDLDIFEGLAKKGSRPPTNGPGAPGASAGFAPPTRSPEPPPVRTQPPPPAPSAPAPMPRTLDVAKKTLVGLQSPVGGAAPRSAPPPPPGRGSLPQIVAPPPRGSRPSTAPVAFGGTQLMSASPAPATTPPPASNASPPASGASAKGGAALDMDWDDEDEATHIFDKHEESKAEPAPRPAAGAATPPPPSVRPNLNQTMPLNAPPARPGLGMTMPLGASPLPSTRTSAPPPPPSSVRTPPPPPPSVGVGNAFARASGGTAAPMPPPPTINPHGGFPPPPPPPSGRHSAAPPLPSRPPPPAPYAVPAPAQYVAPAAPPPNRMEATALVRPPQSRTGLWVALVAALVVIIGGAAAFLLYPRAGRIVVNVADANGGNVGKVEIFVDGKKVCDTAPCIADTIPAGSHIVRALPATGSGYDTPPDQTVTVDSRKDASVSFKLGGPPVIAKKNGTGLRVSGKQPGVKLYVDGKEIGPLPQELTDLAPGDHALKIAGSDRYAPVEKHVIIAQGEMQDLGDQSLKVVKGKATINLLTPGATVFLVAGSDRRVLDGLPKAVDIDTSKVWSLEASRTGYDDYHQTISFDDGVAEKTFDVSLHQKGTPAPTATVVAQVTPTATPTATATPTPTAAPTATDTGTPDQPQAPPAEAYLNINSVPPSSCFLDGRPLGSTPRGHVQVTPGSHTVKFVNAELGLTKTIGVTVGAGETKLAVTKLN